MKKERTMEFPEVVTADLAEALFLLTRMPANQLVRVDLAAGDAVAARFRMTFTGMNIRIHLSQFFANDDECRKVDFTLLPLLFTELSKHTSTLNPDAWMSTRELAREWGAV